MIKRFPFHHSVSAARFFALTVAGFCLMFCYAGIAGARNTATGSVGAEIVQPLHIEAKSDLSFGDVLPSSQDGKVTVTPAGGRQIAGIVHMAPGEFQPARFFVIGAPFFFYSVNTPGTLIFRGIGTDEEWDHGRDDGWSREGDNRPHDDRHLQSLLLVKDFTTFSQNLGSGGNKGFLGRSGKDTLFVGGTLIVPANAMPGHYRGFVPISVAYQ